MRARKNTSAGIWKTSPSPSSMRMYMPNASSMRGMNVTKSVWKLPKKTHISGKAT